MLTERRRALPSRPARLVIVDDHELARAGLRSMLAGDRGLEIVGMVGSGREAVSLCRRTQPDLVLMDVRMPDLDGLAATRAIKSECPATSVVIVTMYENPDYVLEALKAGAAGYLLKDATQPEVVGTVRQVLRGETLLNPELVNQMMRRLTAQATGHAEPQRQGITRRELEVLRFVAQGRTNREIAEALSVSPGTIKIHVERIIHKLHVSDRTQAAVRAIQLGLIAPPTE